MPTRGDELANSRTKYFIYGSLKFWCWTQVFFSVSSSPSLLVELRSYCRVHEHLSLMDTFLYCIWQLTTEFEPLFAQEFVLPNSLDKYSHVKGCPFCLSVLNTFDPLLSLSCLNTRYLVCSGYLQFCPLWQDFDCRLAAWTGNFSRIDHKQSYIVIQLWYLN